MTASAIVRWLHVPVLALAAIWSNVVPARAESCAPASAYQQSDETVAGSVPLVVHIMERPLQPCVVGSQWTPEKVALVFGPSMDDRRGVNSVWGPTGIRFFVRTVEIHEYTPPAGMLGSVPDGPLGSQLFEAGFKNLVTEFHRAGSVNVYLWAFIPGFPMGFGRSPRTGDGKASVWLESACVDSRLVTPEQCGRAAAHELGHALGLYHVGEGCANVPEKHRSLCEMLTAPCGEWQDSERLMKKGDNASSNTRKLCKVEVVEAMKMARELK